MNDFFDSTGRRIPLGKQIGSGSEGAIHQVPVIGNDTVAKIYHHALASEKQVKLQGMVKGDNAILKKIATWPLDTLHVAIGGQIRGFLMPKLVSYEPIHHLYNPAHRKQRYPNVDWSFLIYVARNTAAAFEIIHSHKHVIGDVNPNLVFIAENSTVKLIDCDSFQIFTDGKQHLCEVGVPHFTPSELQTHNSFRGVHRSPNHDNFGLALLIFHLLLMGRHPFAGVFSGTDDMPLEKAIAQFRYAFAHNAAAKGMAPPPNSVTTASLSPLITQLFERAFTELGQQQRPAAKEWRQSLDVFMRQLNTCGQKSIHRYFNNLNTCPWCLYEQKFKHQFFIALLNTTPTGFDLTVVWAKIIVISSPGIAPPFNTPTINSNTIIPKPLPDAIRQARELINATPTFKNKLSIDENEAVKKASQIEIQAYQAANTAARLVQIAETEFNPISQEMNSANELLKNTELSVSNLNQQIAELTNKIEKSKQSIFAFFTKSYQQQMQIKLNRLLLDLSNRRIEREVRLKFNDAKRKLDDAKEQERIARQTFQTAQLEVERIKNKERVKQLSSLQTNLDNLENQERQNRSNILSEAQRSYNELQKNWQNVSNDEPFQMVLKVLMARRNEYENLLQEIELEQQSLQRNLPAIQLQKFLESQFLDQHKIPVIGATRKAVLASNGIETAADIDESRLANIKGFGRQLINILLTWRTSLELNFTFDPSKGIEPADIAAIQQRFAPKLQQIEGDLLAGPEQLNQIKTQLLQQRIQLIKQLQQVYYQVAQAKADLEILK